MRRIKFLILCLIPSLILAQLPEKTLMGKSTVLVCYGKLKPSNIKDYNYVIIESNHYNEPDIKQIKKQNKRVYAYISLGEVNAHSRLYKELKNNTLGKNNNWNSYYLDLKSQKTKEILLSAIKGIFDKGFDGLFLDNVDNFSSYGPQANQSEDLIQLISQIKSKFPKKTLIQNSGYELLPKTSTYIETILFESVATNYLFEHKKYQLRTQKEYETYLKRLNSIKENYAIPILLLEYANSKKLQIQVVKRLAATNFDYCIEKIDLQSITVF